MRARADVFRGSGRMSEPVIGLVVAVLLGVYLAYTLLRPEKF
jgi:K+-transporting ATPase KdpF subunit